MAKQQNASRRGVLALAGLSFALNLPPTAQAAASAPSVSLQRLEWAGIRMRSGAVEVLIDVSGAAATAPTGSRTFALATHHHGDHLDVKALQRLLGDRGYLVLHKDVAP
jgi:L-ascorbate metabolism protein UlaG (beta-lactamase superfamily)